ncbi:MAG: ATP-binding protein [Candidatus Marsarchaeota archaeon]|nr:ATP-binding protein [Candidatus Marsarchaeota archaeon]
MGSTTEIIEKISNINTSSAGLTEFLRKTAEFTKEITGVNEVIVKDVYSKDKEASSSEEFALNTKKPYIDNNLSGYSAFADLIEYFNKGFKSCLVLPITTEIKPIGVITLLSRTENSFSEEIAEIAGLISKMAGYQAIAKIERDRSVNSAKYFDAAFNTIIPQAITDKGGTIVKANKALLNLISCNSKEAQGKPISGLFSSTEKEAQSLRDFGKGVASYKDGKKFVLFQSKISDTLLHNLFYDITEISQLEEKANAMNASPDEVYCFMDHEYKISWVSSNSEKILKISPELLSGRRITDLNQTDEFINLLKKADQEPQKMQVKATLDNSITANISIFVAKSASGYFAILSRNIEGYIASLMRMNRDMVNMSSDAVIMIDPLGYIKDMNKSSQTMLKYNMAEMEGKPITSICSNESQYRLENALAIARTRGQITDMLVEMMNRGGEKIPFSQSIRVLYNDTGAMSGYVLIGRELATSTKLRFLTAELEKSQREIANKKSESDLKTQFIYNISHDLKTPITSILGFSKFLKEGEFGPLNEAQISNIQVVIDEANRLSTLVQQMLDVAKFSSRKIKLDIQKVDLKEIAKNPSINALETEARNKGLEFSFIVDYDVPVIEADPNRLIQVLVNLVNNAIKFTEKGSITVKATRSGKKVKIEVIDTGAGIPKEYKSKLFKKFYQLPKTRQDGRGTGLGLSIVRAIVNLHGSKIHLSSEVNKGSNFWFALPINYVPSKKQQEQ